MKCLGDLTLYRKVLSYCLIVLMSFVLISCNEDDDLQDMIDEEEELPTLVEAAQEAGLTILLDAVEAAGVGQALLDAEEITVFAPSNAAFTALLTALEVDDLDGLIAEIGIDNVVKTLQYHVLPSAIFAEGVPTEATQVNTLAGESLTVVRSGNTVTITDSRGENFNVSTADVAISNGVVHVINGVLLPELDLDEEEEELPTLVEAAQEAGLTTLLDAVNAAGIGQTLLDAESITVFAPTNDAFTALIQNLDGVENLDDLVDFLGGTDGLINVLQYHVLGSSAFAADVPTTATDLEMLNGEIINIVREGDEVTIIDANGNTVTVVIADVAISNGVVHVIDAVLLPDLSEE